jgi:hypothetical protein
LYVTTRRGLPFIALEKQNLLGGRLYNPRAKIRNLYISPYTPNNPYWTPSIRIEIGIMYDVREALEGDELIKAIKEFTKLKVVKVPSYETLRNEDISVKSGNRKRAKLYKLKDGVELIRQKEALGRLILNLTTEPGAAQVHDKMIISGEPLISVHYIKGEIASFPTGTIFLRSQLVENVKINYFQIEDLKIGTWFYELPPVKSRSKALADKRQTIRNVTLAIARYWSELQASKAIYTPMAEKKFGFSWRKDGLLERYKEKTSKFHTYKKWHGAPLGEIRDIIIVHEPDQNSIFELIEGLKKLFVNTQKQIMNKQPSIFVSYSHKDEKFLTYINSSLSSFVKKIDKKISYFVDSNLKPGVEWERELKESIEDASIAVLFLSDNFFSSPYIGNTELPMIKDRCKRQNLIIINIIARPGKKKDEFLEKFQFVNRNKPLSKCSEEQKEYYLLTLRNLISFQIDIQTSNKATKKLKEPNYS